MGKVGEGGAIILHAMLLQYVAMLSTARCYAIYSTLLCYLQHGDSTFHIEAMVVVQF